MLLNNSFQLIVLKKNVYDFLQKSYKFFIQFELVISYKPELKKVTRQKREKRQIMARDMAFF